MKAAASVKTSPAVETSAAVAPPAAMRTAAMTALRVCHPRHTDRQSGSEQSGGQQSAPARSFAVNRDHLFLQSFEHHAFSVATDLSSTKPALYWGDIRCSVLLPNP